MDLKHEKQLLSIYRGFVERCPRQKGLDGSRSYRASIEHPESSLMARVAVEQLSRLNLKMGRDCDNSYQERKLKRLHRQPSCREVSKSCRNCLKTVFQRREKHRLKCNQTCYSTKDPNNILNSQKHLSSRKMSSIQIQHTH